MFLPLTELERRCQKPDYRRVGNWMARRISRPLALRLTRVILPTGISAHAMTLLAWTCGVAAAAAYCFGTLPGWMLGALLLQVWYLLDHVDGQLARFHGEASLDGVQLDYLMHHTINLLTPIGIGCGLAWQRLEPLWQVAGVTWGVSLLLLGLAHDARAKAFLQRLKRLHGTLEVIGGGACRPTPTPPVPRRPLKFLAFLLRKSCETHVLMNLLTLLAAVAWWCGDAELLSGRWLLATLAPAAVLLAAVTLFRSIRRQTAEHEFAAWFRPRTGEQLTFRDGWWHVEADERID
jgi:hypothetical protein